MPEEDADAEYWTDGDGNRRRICSSTLTGALDILEDPDRPPLLVHVSDCGVLVLQVGLSIMMVDQYEELYTCSCPFMGRRCMNAPSGTTPLCMCAHALAAAVLINGFRPVNIEACARIDDMAPRLESLRDEIIPERRDTRHLELWERAEVELRDVRARLRDTRVIWNWLQARRQLLVSHLEPSVRWERYEGEIEDGGLRALNDEITERESNMMHLEEREARLVALRDGIRPGSPVEGGDSTDVEVVREHRVHLGAVLRNARNRIAAINDELKAMEDVGCNTIRAWELVRERRALARHRDSLEEDAWYFEVALKVLETGGADLLERRSVLRSAGGDPRYRRIPSDNAMQELWECGFPGGGH